MGKERTTSLGGLLPATKVVMKRAWLVTILLASLTALSYGNPEPNFSDLVEMYKRGEYEGALRGFQALANNGDVAAQYNLAVMYLNGQGTKYDEAEALRWFTKAAEQGDVRAQYNVAAMYINGTGVPRDYVRAYKWFSVLASQGVKGSQATLNQLAKNMTTAQLRAGNRLYKEWVAGNERCVPPRCESARSKTVAKEPSTELDLKIPPTSPMALAPTTPSITELPRITEPLSVPLDTPPALGVATRQRTATVSDRTSRRLAELEALYQERLISRDEYRSIRQRILRER